jgi:Domain of unknown function (DUF1906)
MSSVRIPFPAPRRGAAVLILAVAAAATLAFAPPAAVQTASPRLAPVAAKAGPTGPVRFPVEAAATMLRGPAFDTCTAPNLRAMSAWRVSRYRGLGIYISGSERSCRQPELTRAWVRRVTRMGYRLLPIHLGRQAPCTTRRNSAKIRPAIAARQGVDAAVTAIERARALGLRPGSALYLDMEHYNATRARCRVAVLRFISGWTRGLHSRGYLSAVYAGLTSGARDLARNYDNPAFLRPDAIWIARWDGSRRLFGWAGIPDRLWRNHQRAKQYRGDHNERHGGVTINIDSDQVDAPVATVLRTFRTTGTEPVPARSGPGRGTPVVRTIAAGQRVGVLCQARGTVEGQSPVWDKLGNGDYVPDTSVSTPSQTGFNPRIPRCTYPRQVNGTTRVMRRTGPGLEFATSGRLSAGALARVVCQRVGTTVGTTDVWNRLRGGAWVSDARLASSGSTGFAPGVPRC